MSFNALFHSLPAEIIRYHVVVQLDSASLASCRAAFGLKYTINDQVIHDGVLHGDEFITWMRKYISDNKVFLHACAQGVESVVSTTVPYHGYCDRVGIAIAAAYNQYKIVEQLKPLSSDELITDATNMAIMQGHKEVIHLLNPTSVSPLRLLCAILSNDDNILSAVATLKTTPSYYGRLYSVGETAAWLLQRFNNYNIICQIYDIEIGIPKPIPFAMVFNPSMVKYLPADTYTNIDVLNMACSFERFDMMEELTTIVGSQFYSVPFAKIVGNCSVAMWEWLDERQLFNHGLVFYNMCMWHRFDKIKLLLGKFTLSNQDIANGVRCYINITPATVKNLVAAGIPPDQILAEAARVGRQRICKIAIAAGAVPTADTYRLAINSGEVAVLKYIHGVVDIPPETISWAIQYNHAHLLHWLAQYLTPTIHDYILAINRGRKFIGTMLKINRMNLPNLATLLETAPPLMHKYIKSFYRPV